MSDCDIDVEAEDPEEFEVVIASNDPVVATVSTLIPVAVVPATLETPVALTTTPESILATATLAEVVAIVDETESAIASLQVSELTGADRWKLDTIHVGARNDPIVVHRLWDRTNAETTRTSGDSSPYVGTDELYEIGCGNLAEGSFCDSGWILLQFVATFYSRFASVPMFVEFTLETADLPNPDDEDEDVAGTWPAFTTHRAWGSKTLTATHAEVEYVFVMGIQSRGHILGTWNQTYHGEAVWDDPAADPEDAHSQKFCRKLATMIDTTIAKTIRSQFRITNQYKLEKDAMNWTESTKTLTQTGAWTGYTPVAGDYIVITAGPSPVVPGTYTIASKTSNDALVLNESITGASPGNVSGNAIECTIQVNFFNVTASRATQLHPAVGSLN